MTENKNRSMELPELQTRTLTGDGDSDVIRLRYGIFARDNFGYFVVLNCGRVIAVVVPDGEAILTYLQKEGWTLSSILLTHTHWDHVVGLEDVLERTGCELIAPVGASSVSATRRVKDGERFQVESVTVEAINTSGHSE
ncbi:MAG: MBL fold metallo-hydrolase [Kiritimatiellae bacterium]|jgi:hydroxyacylglutathione hydrolase|nr:MBL fold metallo-hydrolase [Kiritimatiellia bacterium]